MAVHAHWQLVQPAQSSLKFRHRFVSASRFTRARKAQDRGEPTLIKALAFFCAEFSGFWRSYREAKPSGLCCVKRSDHNSSHEKPLNRLTLANLCKHERARKGESITNVSAQPPPYLRAALVGLLWRTGSPSRMPPPQPALRAHGERSPSASA